MAVLRTLITAGFVAAAAAHFEMPMGAIPRKDMRDSGLGVTAVTSLNVTKFLGRWYQAADNWFMQTTSEANCECVTADYGLNPNGTVSVHNRARLASPDGVESQILGWAAATDDTKPGELTVHLQGVPVGAPFWVFGLGPETNGPDGAYEWALISDYINLSLFVLARNVTDYSLKYNTTVMGLLNKNGFTGYNVPLWTYQGSDCQYY